MSLLPRDETFEEKVERRLKELEEAVAALKPAPVEAPAEEPKAE